MRAALNAAAAALAPVSATPRLDAELLMAHALGVSREALLLCHLEETAPVGFAPLLARRLGGEPVAYIVGSRAFWTIELRVTPAVLIPRPDSETLLEAALAHFGETGPATVLDLGTGSGALLLAALDQWPDASGVGIDRSAAALAVAQDNAARLHLAERAHFRLGDWGEGLEDRFDLILCNPPYIAEEARLPRDVREHEPGSALFAGADGLDDYRRLVPQIPQLLAPGGLACVEIGSEQGESVPALFTAAGMSPRVRRDLSGLPRCVLVCG